MDGTVIGDTVNLAERLEKLTKVYGVAALLCGDTVARLSDSGRHALRWLGRTQVRGTRELVDLHELIAGGSEEVAARRMATREHLAGALRMRDAGERSAATAALRAILAADPDDEAVRALLERADTESIPAARSDAGNR
jgi:hypothetical protein